MSVLDSLTMEWIQPKIRGDPIGVRTRHTAVAVHADYEQYERGETDGTLQRTDDRCTARKIHVCLLDWNTLLDVFGV